MLLPRLGFHRHAQPLALCGDICQAPLRRRVHRVQDAMRYSAVSEAANRDSPCIPGSVSQQAQQHSAAQLGEAGNLGSPQRARSAGLPELLQAQSTPNKHLLEGRQQLLFAHPRSWCKASNLVLVLQRGRRAALQALQLLQQKGCTLRFFETLYWDLPRSARATEVRHFLFRECLSLSLILLLLSPSHFRASVCRKVESAPCCGPTVPWHGPAIPAGRGWLRLFRPWKLLALHALHASQSQFSRTSSTKRYSQPTAY
mmetsp:Transcript_158710/g.281334  ORF Transcript_158710/g.281334 Transcript_158710/m.281334 type:complete len:257 (+) Transcript_158710:1819-2589(+)